MADFSKGGQQKLRPLDRGQGRLEQVRQRSALQQTANTQIVGLGFDKLDDPAADAVLMWDNTAGNVTFNTPGIAAIGLNDPGADRIVFWDDSAGALAYLTAGDNLTITGTQIDAASQGAWDDSGDPVVLNTTTKDVQIGASHYKLAKLSIEGDADQVQLAIEANSMQTENVVVIASAEPGPSILTLNNDGFLMVHESAIKSPDVQAGDGGIECHVKTDVNFGVTREVNVTGAVAFAAYNDAASANIPFEFRASEHHFQTGGVVVGSPTDGHKGAGTINATAVYDDGSLLTDWVFDLHYDGRVKEDDQGRHGNAQIHTIDDTEAFARANRHLPSIPGRETWEMDRPSLGKLATHLWETIERQQIQIFELNERLKALEGA